MSSFFKKNPIPKFMRSTTWLTGGLGTVGGLIYMVYSHRLENRLKHPIVEEAIHLLENNEEVLQLAGAPLVVDTYFRNSAEITPEIANFKFKVKGPRSKFTVELSACSKKLEALGPNSKGKALLRERNAKMRNQEPTPIPTNLKEFNYNYFYVPGLNVIPNEEELFKKNKSGELPRDGEFWKIELLFAELSSDNRILVAPIAENDKEEAPILRRSTYEDLNKEYKERRDNRRDFRKGSTPEEQEELRKWKTMRMYSEITYTRFYMLFGSFLLGMSFYIQFRKNKRISISNSIIHEKAKLKIQRSRPLKELLGDKILCSEQTLGARIGNEAEFSFQFIGDGHYGVANVVGVYDEEQTSWDLKDFNVEVFDKEGERVDREFEFN